MAVESLQWELKEAVAAAVAEQAREAIPLSGYSVGAHLFECAAGLSPRELERARLILAAADAFVHAGEREQVERLLESPALAALEGRDWSELARLRAREAFLRGGLAEGIELLVAEAHRIQADDPDAAVELLVEASSEQAGIEASEVLDRSLALAHEARELAGEGSAAAFVLEALRALRSDAEALSIEQLEDLARPLMEQPSVCETLLAVLTLRGDFAKALPLADGAIESCRIAGRRATLAPNLHVRANVLHREGDWDGATRDYLDAIRAADDLGQRYGSAIGRHVLARIEAARGREEECRALLAVSGEELDRLGLHDRFTVYHAAIERLLYLTLGEYERVLRHVVDEKQLRFPEDWIEAAILVGRPEDAEALLAGFARRAAEFRIPVMQMRVARCRGLLAEDDRFEQEFARAFEFESARPYAFERARIELSLGERLRRAGERKRARDPLRAAKDAFARLGATHWAVRATRELHATGARVRIDVPGAAEQLTAQELAVARAVAAGASNKETAAQLFLSVKTIEFHRKNVYRKLGVDSRSELTRRLTESAT